VTFLLDTNTVSELRPSRARPVDPGLAAWFAANDAATMYLAAITVLELEIGVQRRERSDPTAGMRLRTWLDEVTRAFEGRILPCTGAEAAVTARLHVPDPRPLADSMIAGIALARGLTVVTRNTGDFGPMGVLVVSPWSGTV